MYARVNETVRKGIVDELRHVPQTSFGSSIGVYFQMVGDCRYCLCPQGLTSYTSRLYESYFGGCIPVLLSDDFVPPFAEPALPLNATHAVA